MRETYVSTTFMQDGLHWQQAVALLFQLGIKHIEIGSTHLPPDRENLKIEFSEWQKKGVHFTVHNFFPATTDRFILNLSATDEHSRLRTLDFYKKTIADCAQWGVESYTIHPGFMGNPQRESKMTDRKTDDRNFDFQFDPHLEQDRKLCVAQTIEAFQELSTYAKKMGVLLLVENHGTVQNAKNCLFNCVADFLALYEQIPPESMAINFNMAHSLLTELAGGERLDDMIQKLAPYIRFVELSETQGSLDAHMPMGKNSLTMEKLQPYKLLLKNTSPILEYRQSLASEVYASYRYFNSWKNSQNEGQLYV